MNAGENRASGRANAAVLAGIGFLAVCVRLVCLWQIRDAPFFSIRIGDSEAYHLWAQRIAAGDWLGQGVFYQAPLYPYFLAAIYRAAGDGVATVRWIQAVLGGLSCALLAQAGISLFGRRGALAGLLLAVYPAAIFLDLSLEKSALATLLLTALLALMPGLPQARVRAVFAAGMVLGLLTLTRENALVLALPVLLWLGSGRRACMLAAGATLVLLPVALRNAVVGGEFHLTTAQLGPNLYIGNHVGANGTYQALVTGHGNASDERQDATRLAEQAAGRRLTAGEVSRYWTGRGVAYACSEPAAWLRLLARKAALAFNAAEVSDTESQEIYAAESRLLGMLRPFDFGLLLALAAMGTAFSGGLWQRLWWLYAVVLTYAATLVLFYVLGRYRFLLAPALMLMAAGGLPRVFDFRKRLPAAVLAGAAALAFAHLPLDDAPAARATNYANIAGALAKEPSRGGDAAEYYRRALNQVPRFPPALFGTGVLLARNGQHAHAIPYYAAALEERPDYAEARYNLGLSLAALGRDEEAAREYAAAVELVPGDIEARLALGKALLALGRFGEAAAHYRNVLALEPGSVPARVGIGVSLARAGETVEALEQLRQALAADPQNASAHNSLGAILASSGRISEALPHFEQAVALNPEDMGARQNLDTARGLLSRPR